MRLIIRIFIALTTLCTLQSSLAAPYKRAILISIDGLRPDVLQKTPTPNLDFLASNGLLGKAKAVIPVKTLPNHASMISGVTPERHGLTWNDYRPEEGMIQVPTLFQLAKFHQLTSAFIFGKKKLLHFATSDIDYLELPQWPVVSTLPALFPNHLGKKASDILYRNDPAFTFIHFPTTDLTGHTFSWGSCPQIWSLIATDRAIGRLISTVKDKNQLNQTLWIFTADHGGHGFGHGEPGEDGAPEPIDQTIPFLISGPGIGEETLKGQLSTLDIAPTLAWALGMEAPAEWGWSGQIAITGPQD